MSPLTPSASSPRPPRRPPTQPQPVELASQERSVHRKLPELMRILETYSEKLRVMIAKMVWQPAPVTIGPIEVLDAKQLEDIVRRWPTGAQMMWPQVGTVGYLGMNPLLSHSLIDLAYGTPADRLTASGAAERPHLTHIDRATLEPIFLRLVRTLTEALAPTDTPAATIAMLAAPFQLTMPSATRSALLCTLEFPLTGQTGSVTMVLFSPVLEHLDSTASAAKQDTTSELAEHLQTTHVTLTALLGRAQLMIAQIASMRPGQLIWLDRSTHEELPVLIEDKVKFMAQPRQRNGTLGVQIVRRVP